MTTPSEVTTGTGSPSARIVKIEAPVASPGSCAICGKDRHPDGFADANLNFEFHGAFYLCADCVSEYARLFGFISPNEMVGLRDHIAAQDLELNTLRQAVLGLESTVDGLIADAHRRSTERADRIKRDRDDRGRSDVPIDPVDQPDEGPTDEGSGVSTPAPVEREQRPAEQVNQQGRNDLLDTSDADELLGL